MGTRRRIPVGPLIGLLGALLLLVSLFVNWWEEVTAFTAFEVLDLALAGLALAAIASLAEAIGARLPSAVALGAGLALPLGAVALLIVLSQLANDPPAIVDSDRGPELGIWLALAGALLMVGGSLLAVARISLALDLERRERPERREREHRGEPAPDEAPTAAEPTGPEPRPERTAPERPGPERPAGPPDEPERPV